MREMKFRAWDEERERMIYFEALRAVWFYQDGYRIQSDETEESAGDRDFIAHDDYRDKEPLVKLMEYTGLKDEGGIEIYEGDIIYFTYFGLFDTDEQHKGIVKYDDERAEYMLEVIGSKQEERFSLGWIHYQDDEIEIIGNIHENPELLETK